MVANITSALNAYNKMAESVGKPGMDARGTAPGQTFADMLGDVAKDAKAGGLAAEKLSIQAVAGKADINDVVTAVANAEVTLQTVVAVRDKVIAAYQDILRMPI
jgi:flagellar hook-basal body complex protein FliE